MAEACLKIFSEFRMEAEAWAEFDSQLNSQPSDVHAESAQHNFQESRAVDIDAELNQTNLTDRIMGNEIPTEDFNLSEYRVKAWEQFNPETQLVPDSRDESRSKVIEIQDDVLANVSESSQPKVVDVQHQGNIPALVYEEFRSPDLQPISDCGVEANFFIESEDLGEMWDFRPAAPLDFCQVNNTTAVTNAASSTLQSEELVQEMWDFLLGSEGCHEMAQATPAVPATPLDFCQVNNTTAVTNAASSTLQSEDLGEILRDFLLGSEGWTQEMAQAVPAAPLDFCQVNNTTAVTNAASSTLQSEDLGEIMWDFLLGSEGCHEMAQATPAVPAAPLDFCLNNTTAVTNAASSTTLPDFQACIDLDSLLPSTPDSGLATLDSSGNSSLTATASNHVHMAYSYGAAKRPRLETERSALFGKNLMQARPESEQRWHSGVRNLEPLVFVAEEQGSTHSCSQSEARSNVVTGSDTSKTSSPTIEPSSNLILPKPHRDPFEMEKIHICVRMVGKREDIMEVKGLRDELNWLVYTYKRCRDERRPTHLQRKCECKPVTTAFECCWSKEFGSSEFPDEKRIKEIFQQKCTRAVNSAIHSKGQKVNRYPDFVNTRCEEWFMSNAEHDGFSTRLALERGEPKDKELKKLAYSLGLTVDQIHSKWSYYRVIKSEQRDELRRKLTKKETKRRAEIEGKRIQENEENNSKRRAEVLISMQVQHQLSG